jgi:hypothetical protein
MRKLLCILVPVAFLICFVGFILLPTQGAVFTSFILAIVGLIAFYLICLAPIFIWLAIGFVLFAPVFLLLLLISLFWRDKRWRTKPDADQQLPPLPQPLPAPATPPQEKPIPLMQRQFRH